jgi:hypothetical protein
MAKKLPILNKLRPKLKPQGIADFGIMAKRIARNTTFHPVEIQAALNLYVEETLHSLENGETVKLNGLANLTPNIQIGGRVNMLARWDRAAVARLNNPQL